MLKFKFGRLVSLAVKLLVFFTIIYLLISAYRDYRFGILFKKEIKEYADEYNIDPHLVAAVISVESSFDEKASSPKGARGLMQIMPDTGSWIASKLDLEDYDDSMLYDPSVNIRMGTWLLNSLSKEFDYELETVLAAYNAGSGTVSKWLKDESCSRDGRTLDYIAYKETAAYVDKVINKRDLYRSKYEDIFSPKNLNKDGNFTIIIKNIKRKIKGLLN